MSLIEAHPLTVGLLLFGFAYLNSRASTPRHPRVLGSKGRPSAPDEQT